MLLTTVSVILQSTLYFEYRQDPLSFSVILFSDESWTSKNTDKFIKEINEATKFAKLAIEEANVRNADIVGSKKKEQEFQIGDEVMLSSEKIALKPGNVKKRAPKCITPLKLKKKFANGLAHQLTMLKELEAVHDTFHISLVKPYAPDELKRNEDRTS